MHQTVHDPTLGIEAPDDLIEIARVVMLVAPPDRPSKEIRNLDQTRCGRVHEQVQLQFALKPADGVIGSQVNAVQGCYRDFRALARTVARQCGITIA